MNNEDGHKSELGTRKYRPEYPADHPRDHRVFWPHPIALGAVIAMLEKVDARHRAVFVSAAAVAKGYFLDLMQTHDEIPVPADPWCAILNDDEPERGGARGPNFFHQHSLGLLVSRAKTIVVSSVGARAENYGVACERTARYRENCLLIETQPNVELAWMEFVATKGGGRYTLIMEAPDAQDLTIKGMLKNKPWRNRYDH